MCRAFRKDCRMVLGWLEPDAPGPARSTGLLCSLIASPTFLGADQGSLAELKFDSSFIKTLTLNSVKELQN